MNKKFGLWPKLALLLILGVFVAHKYQVADDNLKAFKAERAAHESPEKVVPAPQVHVGQLIVEPPADQGALNPVDTQRSVQEGTPGKLDHSRVFKTDLKVQNPDPIPIAYSQADGVVETETDPENVPAQESGGLWGFVKANWASLVTALLAFVEAIIRITPSDKDNSIFSFIKFILDKIIPNARAGGGTHA